MAKSLVLLRRFYVYGIKIDGVTRYIGKGSFGRIYSHAAEARSGKHKNSKLNAALRDGHITYVLYRDDLGGREALRLETKTIAAFHKRRPGQLFNGPQRSTEDMARMLKVRWSDPAARAKHSEAIKAKWCNPEWVERTRTNMKVAAKQRWQESGYRGKVSDAVSEAISAKWQNDPEYRVRWKRGRWG